MVSSKEEKMKRTIRLTKLSPSADPLYPTSTKESWKYGEFNREVSPPIDYTVEGYIYSDPKVGIPLRIDRYKRNEVEVLGEMITSKIVKWDGLNLETLNSKYTLVYLD